MDLTNSINMLKKYIADAYKGTQTKIGSKISRGHLRSISTDIEDGVALFISKLQQNHTIFIDPSVHVNNKNNRPDILVVNENNEVVAMIEMKANMGWCRNASGVIDDIVANNSSFKAAKTLKCEFSTGETQSVTYGDSVKCFLISFTDGNCAAKTMQQINHTPKAKTYINSIFFPVGIMI